MSGSSAFSWASTDSAAQVGGRDRCAGEVVPRSESRSGAAMERSAERLNQVPFAFRSLKF